MTDREPNPRYAWYVVAILTLASLSGNIDRMILSLLVGPIKRDLGISETQMGYLMGLAFSILFALLGLPIARLADRANRRNIMAAGVGLWSLFTAACATAQTYARLMVLRVGVGVGEATLSAPSVSLLADYFPRERLSRAMSVYSMSIFFGSGLAYFIGGSIVGLVAETGQRVVPIIGAIRPWQLVFLFVGLPGLAVALLIWLTVREPQRTGQMSSGGALPVRVLFDYVRANRRTFATQSFGFAFSAMVNYSIGAWLATFLVRTYGWTEARAGQVMGTLTMTVGCAGVIAGGWVADWLVRRGHVDGPLRVGIIGALGMLVSATAYPLMPNAHLAVAWLVLVNFFAAFPWGAASAAAAEIVPTPLRAQGAALYFFVVSLVSSTLGPSSVAWLTDYAFRDASAIRYSLVIVNIAGMTLAILLFAIGLPAYRKTVVYRDRWSAEP